MQLWQRQTIGDNVQSCKPDGSPIDIAHISPSVKLVAMDRPRVTFAEPYCPSLEGAQMRSYENDSSKTGNNQGVTAG